MRVARSWFALGAGLFLILAIGVTGCQTLREVANLRRVDFNLDRISNTYLAGVDVDRIQTYQDLRASDLSRIGRAVADGRLPLDFTLHLQAENPEENGVNARMVRMDWTLFLNDRQTVSGVLDEQFVIAPGQAREIPMRVELDLLNFFEGGARDLVDLVLAITSGGPGPEQLRLEATPTIDTPIGPIRYPQPITISYRDVR